MLQRPLILILGPFDLKVVGRWMNYTAAFRKHVRKLSHNNTTILLLIITPTPIF